MIFGKFAVCGILQDLGVKCNVLLLDQSFAAEVRR